MCWGIGGGFGGGGGVPQSRKSRHWSKYSLTSNYSFFHILWRWIWLLKFRKHKIHFLKSNFLSIWNYIWVLRSNFLLLQFYTVHHSDWTSYMLNIDFGTIKIRRPRISMDKIRSDCFMDEKWKNITNCNLNISTKFVFFVNFQSH